MNNLLHYSTKFLNKHASTILTCLGGIGVVTTTVLAVKATPKALLLLEQAEQEKGEDLTKLELVKVAAPAYIPTAVSGVTTLACIFGANILNKRHQASLMSAYALLDNSYKEYRNKVKELHGDDEDKRVIEEIAKDKLRESAIIREDEKQLFYEPFSGRYFNSTMEDVLRAEYMINREILVSGYASVNELYDYLGLERIDGGNALGWSSSIMADAYWQYWLDFEHDKLVDDDGLEYYVITMSCDPSTERDDEYEEFV